ncbi:LOW QUALITY PROTEIN: uncharacterized protein [Montipora capricornis]|uniref:LOW QUALITY PROTEIN: uncharacterized protein n=1 Tax=Montipora capricornis TaxID=246305 RepID=UPI0035F1D6CA
MEDDGKTSGNPRKRKSLSQDCNDAPSCKTEKEESRKKTAKRGKKWLKRKKYIKKKEQELKLFGVVPHKCHLFGKLGFRADSPVTIQQLRDLILFVALHQTECQLTIPQWCKIGDVNSIQKVVIVFVSGIGLTEYEENQDCFPHCNTLFKQCVQTKAVGITHVEPPHESLLSPNLPKQEENHMSSSDANKVFGREDYILSMEEMEENGFPLPTSQLSQASKVSNDNGYLSTKPHQRSTNSTESPMFAVDCEMCITTEGVELTRISVVDESLNVLYDTLVKPSSQIVDYKTEYSGITPDMLKDVTTTLADVQKHLINLLPADAILLGHSLENDLQALKLYHERVIDSSVMYAVETNRGRIFKVSLRRLADQYLRKKIQAGKDGHCSIEDAKVCMQLVQLKLKSGPDLKRPPIVKEGLFQRTAHYGKIASLLGHPEIPTKFGSGATYAIKCTSDEQIVSHAAKLMQESEILWAHLNEPEIFSEENELNLNEELETKWKCVLQSVDSRVEQIHDAVPSDSLLMVFFGCGNLCLVKKLQRKLKLSREKGPTELKEAVKSAKQGLCFLKVT